MEYLDFYDYPTYNWEIVSSMDGWETHPVPRSACRNNGAPHGGIRTGDLMGRKVPFEILLPLETDWRQSHRLVAVSQSDRFAMGLCSCGKVFTAGVFGSWDYENKCELIHWQDIVALETGPGAVVGVRKDGRVSVVGWKKRERFSKWRDVKRVSVGDSIILGLRKDGTMLSVGNELMGQKVAAWRGITQVSASDYYVLGVRCDGTVAYADGGLLWDGSDPTTWTDIVQVSAGPYHAVGLRRDGTLVVAVCKDYYEFMDDVECLAVTDWHDVRQVCAGKGITAALLANGDVLEAHNERDEGPYSDEPYVPAYTGVVCHNAVAISVNRHASGSEEVLALDAQGRAIMCSSRCAYPWDNWCD